LTCGIPTQKKKQASSDKDAGRLTGTKNKIKNNQVDVPALYLHQPCAQ
jgi:hypothetical protein